MFPTHKRCAAIFLPLLTLIVVPAHAFDLGNLQNQVGAVLQQPKTNSGGAAVDALSAGEVGQGLKAALSRGVDTAVAALGRTDGLYGNKQWRIPLPPTLDKVANVMRMVGRGDQADALELAMNRAAETAVPQAKTLLVSAVKDMSIADAKGILTGGDEAATEYFRRKTSAQLVQQFAPIVSKATAKVGLAQTYNNYAGQAAQFGLLRNDEASLDRYVAQEAVNRLYQAIGEQEKALRADPVGSGSAIISKVFGAVR
ncbi:DUF4197 domain-containing protein [Ralstonia sp. 25C]|uniref:DUF4197 domain-containing protein n=1 Tax=Ralstonia sp. 25C TaxID=3447363 RepID=UPI003F7544B2